VPKTLNWDYGVQLPLPSVTDFVEDTEKRLLKAVQAPGSGSV